MAQAQPAPAAQPPATSSEHKGGSASMFGLGSWVLFTIIAEHGTLKIASIAALVIAFVADPSLTHWLTRYARAIAAGVLSLLVFGSLLFVPFTEECAREMVPREYWKSERFKEVNRKLTVLWGEVFLVMMASHIIAGAVNERATNIVFNWVIPIALVIWGTKQSTAEKDPKPVVQQA